MGSSRPENQASWGSFFSGNRTPAIVYYKGASQVTERIDHHPKFNAIRTCIERLRAKVTQLNQCASAGAEGAAYAKATFLSALLRQIDSNVRAFNYDTDGEKQSVSAEWETESLEMARLVQNILQKVSAILDNATSLAAVNEHRDSNKEMARNTVDIGLIGGTAAVSLPLPFMTGAAYVGGAWVGSKAIKRYFGLDSTDTDSFILLTTFKNELEAAAKLLPTVPSPASATRPKTDDDMISTLLQERRPS